MRPIRIIFTFVKLWIRYRDRFEAWQDATIIHDRQFQKEIDEIGKLIQNNLNNVMNRPCKFDHNGECEVCDNWSENCSYLRHLTKDYSVETREELEEMFKIINKDEQANIYHESTSGNV